MASGHTTSWQIEKVEAVTDFSFLGLQNHCRWWLQPWSYKMLDPWKKNYDKPRQRIQKQRHHFADKGLSSQSYGFASGHVRMWVLDYKEGWALKNWCFRIVVLEKTLESPSDCKEIKPVCPKGVMLKLQYFGHLMQRAGSLAKTLILGKIEDKSWRGRQRMIWLDSIADSMDYPGDSEGQGSLTCCGPWGCKESERT